MFYKQYESVWGVNSNLDTKIHKNYYIVHIVAVDIYFFPSAL